MEYKAYALLAILIASVAAVGSSALAASASVTTDKPSYTTGDIITVSGNVGTVKPGVPALIQIFNPNNAIYRYDVISASEIKSDGSFTYNPTPPLRVGGSLGISGQYKVVISYGGQNVAQTTFQFTNTSPTGGNVWKSYTVTAGGQTFPVQYMIKGGTLSNITADTSFTSLKAFISSSAAGTLWIKIPRALMDAKTSNGTDDDFVVFSDEVPNQDFQQVANMTDSTTRTLAINFEQGTATIEIVGTQIAPEFGAGTIAAIILAIAIVVTIVASTRYNKKINFLPK